MSIRLAPTVKRMKKTTKTITNGKYKTILTQSSSILIKTPSETGGLEFLTTNGTMQNEQKLSQPRWMDLKEERRLVVLIFLGDLVWKSRRIRSIFRWYLHVTPYMKAVHDESVSCTGKISAYVSSFESKTLTAKKSPETTYVKTKKKRIFFLQRIHVLYRLLDRKRRRPATAANLDMNPDPPPDQPTVHGQLFSPLTALPYILHEEKSKLKHQQFFQT